MGPILSGATARVINPVTSASAAGRDRYTLTFGAVFMEEHTRAGFVQVIEPSALDAADLSALRPLHWTEWTFSLGSADDGTLRASWSEGVLSVWAAPPAERWAYGLRKLLEHPGGSVAHNLYVMLETPADGSGEEWATDEYGRTVRTITKVERVVRLTLLPRGGVEVPGDDALIAARDRGALVEAAAR